MCSILFSKFITLAATTWGLNTDVSVTFLLQCLKIRRSVKNILAILKSRNQNSEHIIKIDSDFIVSVQVCKMRLIIGIFMGLRVCWLLLLCSFLNTEFWFFFAFVARSGFILSILTLVRLLAIFMGQIDPRTWNLDFYDLTTVGIMGYQSVNRDYDCT